MLKNRRYDLRRQWLTLAPLGGGPKGPPLWFFANSS